MTVKAVWRWAASVLPKVQRITVDDLRTDLKAHYETTGPHDFHRSVARNMERAGVPRSVAMKISGHKTEFIYRRYAIVTELDIQDATRRLLGHNLGTLPSPLVDIAHVSG